MLNMKNDNLLLIKKENELKESSNNLLENQNAQILHSTDISFNYKDELKELKIEKDNLLDNINYSNDIEKSGSMKKQIINKRRFGNTFPLFFKNGEPRIVIGPHCIFI